MKHLTRHFLQNVERCKVSNVLLKRVLSRFVEQKSEQTTKQKLIKIGLILKNSESSEKSDFCILNFGQRIVLKPLQKRYVKNKIFKINSLITNYW